MQSDLVQAVKKSNKQKIKKILIEVEAWMQWIMLLQTFHLKIIGMN